MRRECIDLFCLLEVMPSHDIYVVCVCVCVCVHAC